MGSMRTILALLAVGVATAELHPESDLSTECFNFPEKNFNRKNCIKDTYGTSPYTAGGLVEGDMAFDFTLYDLNGDSHTLSKMLEEKPVVLIWGMYTCPAFEGLVGDYPFDQASYTDEYNVVDEFKDSATFVHLVGPEPHPLTPDTNFDSGMQKMNYWSTVRQPLNYDDRLTMTKKISSFIHEDALLLPDLFTDNPYNDLVDPVWCTMGLGARTAMIVKQDGTVAFTQDWFRKDDLADAISSLK